MDEVVRIKEENKSTGDGVDSCVFSHFYLRARTYGCMRGMHMHAHNAFMYTCMHTDITLASMYPCMHACMYTYACACIHIHTDTQHLNIKKI